MFSKSLSKTTCDYYTPSKAVIPIKREGKKPQKSLNVLQQARPRSAQNPEQHQYLSEIITAKQQELRSLQKSQRKQINYPTDYPFSANGLVKSTVVDGHATIGTGSIIGPKYILTSAHNLFDRKIWREHTEIQFQPAASVVNKLNIKFKVKRFYIPYQYKKKCPEITNKQPFFLFDYAILELDTQENLEQYFGSFSYDFDNQHCTQGKIINDVYIMGFRQENGEIRYQSCSGQAYVDTNYLIYKFQTLPGFSGAGILTEQPNTGLFSIIGIHEREVEKIIGVRGAKAGLRFKKSMFCNIDACFRHLCDKYDLRNQQIDQQDICTLVKSISENNDNAVQLYICKNTGIENEGCKMLAKINNLEILNLKNNQIGTQAFEFLTKSKCQKLQILNLDYNRVQSQGCFFLKLSTWKNITELHLVQNFIGPQGCESLSEIDWPNLQLLDLKQNKIKSEGCRFLSRGCWANLQILVLQGNKIEAQGCVPLAQTGWQNLLTLNLSRNCIGDEGCRFLCVSKLSKLRKLFLAYNNIQKSGCRYLSQKTWDNLRVLELRCNDIGNEGCLWMQQAEWKVLEFLDLYRNNIGLLGCQSLSKAKWPRLKQLNLSQNYISENDLSLFEKLPWKIECRKEFWIL